MLLSNGWGVGGVCVFGFLFLSGVLMFKVTKEWIDAYKTPNGGYCAAQLKMLGISFPLVSGWKDKAIGRLISFEAKDAFEAGAVSKSQARKKAKSVRSESKKATKNRRHEEKRVLAFVASSKINPASPEFLLSFEWRAVRMQAIKKYGAICQCCGASPATGAVMNVDHIKPRKTHPHLALVLDNLQVLCHECNHGKGNWDTTDWRPMNELDMAAAEHLKSIK